MQMSEADLKNSCRDLRFFGKPILKQRAELILDGRKNDMTDPGFLNLLHESGIMPNTPDLVLLKTWRKHSAICRGV